MKENVDLYRMVKVRLSYVCIGLSHGAVVILPGGGSKGRSSFWEVHELFYLTNFSDVDLTRKRVVRALKYERT